MQCVLRGTLHASLLFQYVPGKSMRLKINLRDLLLCPFQLLIDLYNQLSPADVSIEQLAFEPFGALDSANDWINLESLGNIVPIRAQALLKTILPVLPDSLALDIYLKNKKITSDNLYSLFLIADKVNHLHINIHDEQSWDETAKNDLSQLFAHKNVSLDFGTYSEPHKDTAVLEQLHAHSHAVMAKYGFDFSSTEHINLLIGYSWSLLKTGAPEVATNLLEDALSSALPHHHSLPLLHLQIIRFHAHQYKKLALQEYPTHFEGIDEASVNYLHYLKAYAATLTRNVDIAERHFALAGISEQLHLVDEYSLYQLNIFALFHVHKQKMDVAYRFEKTIEQFIKDHLIESIGLKYVNFINIARLYKKEGLYDQSLDYYSKAYLEISQGGYTPSDHIYYHMNFGGIYEAMGDTLRALSSWINAALHWLVADNPYSLAWRPKLILCGEKTEDLNKPLVLSNVTSFFCTKIAELLKELAIDHPVFQELDTFPTATEPSLNFCLNHPSIPKKSCHVELGMVVYSSQAVCNPIHSELAPLANYLSKILKATLLKNVTEPTLVIDNLCDITYLANESQAQWLALINDCDRCFLNGEPLLLNPETLKKLQSQIKPSLSMMIESIEEEGERLKLKYKRDFLNKTLDDQQEIAVCKALQQNDHSYLNAKLLPNLPLLQQMMHKKIISVSV